MDVEKIEQRVDRVVAGAVTVNADLGGVILENMAQVMEFAKLMSISGAAVPKYLRGNPGACLAICSRALRWQMDPFAVAEKSYMVMNRGDERVAYEAQLIHAVVESRAPLKGRLRHEIIGEGDERRCKVWGTFKGETEPHTYLSEPLGKLREQRGRNQEGGLKGSPLWETQPEVQLAYSAVRQWARLFSPDTLLGVYSTDELETEPVDVTPFAQRLAEKLAKATPRESSRGFDQSHVNSIIEGENTDEITESSKGRSERQGRPDDDASRGDGDHDSGGNTVGGGNPQDRRKSADQSATQAKDESDQKDVFPPDRKPKAKSRRK
jgi:hypothetical protein